MIPVDANVLLDACHPRSERHRASRQRLESVLGAPESVRFAWLTLWAFVRIATNPRVFERPLAPAETVAAVSSWRKCPNCGILEPGERRHWEILRHLIDKGQVDGALVTRAALAALAIEQGATLCSVERDFARFPGLSWRNPLAALARRQAVLALARVRRLHPGIMTPCRWTRIP